MNIELTKDQEEAIIPSALEFIRILTEQLGPDVGMTAWDQLITVFGSDIKGRVFFEMISSTGIGRNVTILPGPISGYTTGSGRTTQMINAIKLIRAHTGLGLKDSKDIVDQVAASDSRKIKIMDPKHRADFIAEIRLYGFNAQ